MAASPSLPSGTRRVKRCAAWGEQSRGRAGGVSAGRGGGCADGGREKHWTRLCTVDIHDISALRTGRRDSAP